MAEEHTVARQAHDVGRGNRVTVRLDETARVVRVQEHEVGLHEWPLWVCRCALGIFEDLSYGELRWIAEHAQAEELAVALKAVSARVRARLRDACSSAVWASVEARTAQIGPVRLSDVERTQMELAQRPRENFFV